MNTKMENRILCFRWQHSRRWADSEGGRNEGEERIQERTDRRGGEANYTLFLSFLAWVSQHACLVTPLGRTRGRGHVIKGAWSRHQRSYSRLETG